MVIGGWQGARNQQVAIAETVHALDPAADSRQVLAHIRVGRAVPLDRQRQAIQALALLFELRRCQGIGSVGVRVIEHGLDPTDDAEPMLMRDGQEVLEGRSAVEVVPRVGDPYI